MPVIARLAVTSPDRAREVIHRFNEEGMDSLHLVEHDPDGQVGNEPGRIGPGRVAGRVVVEGDVVVRGPGHRPGRGPPVPVEMFRRAHRLSERGLAALARPMDHHRGRVLKRLEEQAANMTRIEHGTTNRQAICLESANCKVVSRLIIRLRIV